MFGLSVRLGQLPDKENHGDDEKRDTNLLDQLLREQSIQVAHTTVLKLQWIPVILTLKSTLATGRGAGVPRFAPFETWTGAERRDRRTLSIAWIDSHLSLLGHSRLQRRTWIHLPRLDTAILKVDLRQAVA